MSHATYTRPCCARNYVALTRSSVVRRRVGWGALLLAEGERNIFRLG
jgi:hypothetical protein